MRIFRLTAEYLITFISVFVLFGLSTGEVSSADFESRIRAVYEVSASGRTYASYTVNTKNLKTELYLDTFRLLLSHASVENASAKYNGKPLNVLTDRIEDKTALAVRFEEALVGMGKEREFILEFEDPSLASRTGEVWEVILPVVAGISGMTDFTTELRVPKSFGRLAYLSPEPTEVHEGDTHVSYIFDKYSLSGSGISAAFGLFQVFSFELVYHLENPINQDTILEIAIPPDTAFQKVIYNRIEPAPANVTVDPDGNWLASYNLSPREAFSVRAFGNVQIYASPREMPVPTEEFLNTNLLARKYWETDDGTIRSVAAKLNTPREVYDYVVNTLTYNYNRVRPNIKRLGAKEALLNPGNAICMEFTDLFIALARSAGIPAREVNGFAYTENNNLEPISLVADVLHSWPEYWDYERKAWIPVDPTWAHTTGGADYFTKLDLRHITFVNHGNDPEKPFSPGSYKLGANPQKDVVVTLGKLPETRPSDFKLSITKESNFSMGRMSYVVSVFNPGPTSLYSKNIDILFDGVLSDTSKIDVLPPYSTHTFSVGINPGLLGRNAPKLILARSDGIEAVVETDKKEITLTAMAAVASLLFIVMTAIALYFWRSRRRSK